MSQEQPVSLNLQRSKRFATLALVVAVVAWLILIVLAKFFPEYAWLIHIFMLAAEAGVVGGLADWYAITVLFRNPFGHFPLPQFLRDHTAIIPRNKNRIAESMGRFVQENFLSPQIVAQSLQKTDLSLAAGKWLAQPENSEKITVFIQQNIPKIFEFVGQEQLTEFIQNNSVEWLENTKINHLMSEILRAILENDFHEEVLQRGLDHIRQWMLQHPEKVEEITKKLFKELGIWKFSRGINWLGIDMQKRSIDAFIEKIETILAQPEHPWRVHLEQLAQETMQQLNDSESVLSIKLNMMKNELLNHTHTLDFIRSSIAIFCSAIQRDLQKPNSGIAQNIKVTLEQIGQNMMLNVAVRQLLNEKLSDLVIKLSDRYSEKIIKFVSQRIHEWDSAQMINKIENEVGADLHMIRVNGVVVGAFIGFVLGLIRFIIDFII